MSLKYEPASERRYTRPAGQPRAAERKLMRLVEENLALLVAAQVSYLTECIY